MHRLRQYSQLTVRVATYRVAKNESTTDSAVITFFVYNFRCAVAPPHSENVAQIYLYNVNKTTAEFTENKKLQSL